MHRGLLVTDTRPAEEAGMTDDHDPSMCACPWCVKQRALKPNHDEIAAHCDVDWNIELGED